MTALRTHSEFGLTALSGGPVDFDMVKPVLWCHDMDKIEELEDQLSSGGHNRVEEVNLTCMEHEIVNGMVRRTLFIPKGMFITGRIHKAPYIDMVIWGDVAVQTPTGVERYNQFTMLEGLAGRKRVLYTFEDTMWVTVDRTNVDDLEKVEDDVTCAKFADYHSFLEQGEQEG